MRTPLKAALFGGAIFAAGITTQAKAQSYRLGGPSTIAVTTPGGNDNYWTWDQQPSNYGGYDYGGYMSHFREAIEDTSLFGRGFGAPANHRVIASDIDSFDYDFMHDVDGLIFPFVEEPSLTLGSERMYIDTFFARGGDLLILADSSSTDPINSYFGVPTFPSAYGSAFQFTGGFPAFDGPFGPSAYVFTNAIGGAYGVLSEAQINFFGGRVIGRNEHGEPTVAFWDEGDYCQKCGAMLIVTNVNVFTERVGFADYSDLTNPNTRFALNALAALFGSEPPSGADCDGNGLLNVDDIDCYVDSFLSGEL